MHAGDERRPLPVDPALPALQHLNPGPLADLLARHAGGARVSDARVRHLDWTPGHRVLAHVDALVAAPGGQPAGRREALVRVGAGVRVQDVRWVPDDPDLPLLGVGWARTAPRLRYVPGRRVAVRVGDRVIKGYSSPDEYTQARDGLETLHTALGDQAARPDRPMGHLLTTVQRAVDGTHRGEEDPVGTALAAGEVLHRLHASGVRTPHRVTVRLALMSAERPVRLLESALPEQGRRARRLLDLLGSSAPSDDDVVLSHGDYTREQIVQGSSGVVVLDADTVAMAPRAYDVATYPADLVTGRAGDAERAEEALDGLLDGYGIGPRHLDWHFAAALLRRCDEPFRRLASRWHERTASVLDTAEEVTSRCAAMRI